MQELKGLASSPAFWVGTVVAGLIINLISAYMKEPMDRFFFKISTAYRNRSAASRAKYERDLQLFLASGQEVQFRREVRHQLQTISALAFITVLMALMVFGNVTHPAEIPAWMNSIGMAVVSIVFLLVCIDHVRELSL